MHFNAIELTKLSLQYDMFLIMLTEISDWLNNRVFANGLGEQGSILDRVIPKAQKVVLDTSLFNTQHYKVRIKSKVEQSGKGVAPSPTPQCSSYWKGSFQVALDYGGQLYFTYYIYTYHYLFVKFIAWCLRC